MTTTVLDPDAEAIDPVAIQAQAAAIDLKAAQERAIISRAEFLNRDYMAKWLGCSPAYLDKLVAKGLHYNDVEGHRMYGKTRTREWLATYEV